jgi:hypothetical protein
MRTGNRDERPDDADDAEALRELAELRARADQPDPWSGDAAPRKSRKAKRPRPRGYRRPQSRTPAGLQRESRDRRAVEMRSRGFSYDRIAAELGLANKGGAHKAVERGLKRCETASALSYFCLELLRVEAVERECSRRIFTEERPSARLFQTAINLWEQQDGLRRIELDAFARAMCSDTSRGWDRQVAIFIRANRSRCKLLGLFHDPRRGPLGGSNLPTSPDVEAEMAETILVLVEWRRQLLLSPSEAV